jgi:ClpP class serine protease
MTRAFRALAAEPWVIEPSWLPVLAAIALRQPSGVKADPSWAGRSVELIAGPKARKMEGSSNTVISADGVALLPVFGPIFPRASMMTELSGATTCSSLQSDYQLALANPDVGAVMVLLDSPGGHASQIAAFADQLWAGRRAKPTWAYAMGNACSAAYWLGSQCSQFYADRTAVIGSIGVACGVSKQVEPDADGEVEFDFVSTNAPDKRADPATDEGKAQIVAMLDGLEAQFLSDVARGRATTPTKVKADYGKGGVLVGQAAVDAGMVDGVSSYDAAYGQLARLVANQRKVQALKA